MRPQDLIELAIAKSSGDETGQEIEDMDGYPIGMQDIHMGEAIEVLVREADTFQDFLDTGALTQVTDDEAVSHVERRSEALGTATARYADADNVTQADAQTLYKKTERGARRAAHHASTRTDLITGYMWDAFTMLPSSDNSADVARGWGLSRELSEHMDIFGGNLSELADYHDPVDDVPLDVGSEWNRQNAAANLYVAAKNGDFEQELYGNWDINPDEQMNTGLGVDDERRRLDVGIADQSGVIIDVVEGYVEDMSSRIEEVREDSSFDPVLGTGNTLLTAFSDVAAGYSQGYTKTLFSANVLDAVESRMAGTGDRWNENHPDSQQTLSQGNTKPNDDGKHLRSDIDEIERRLGEISEEGSQLLNAGWDGLFAYGEDDASVFDALEHTYTRFHNVFEETGIGRVLETMDDAPDTLMDLYGESGADLTDPGSLGYRGFTSYIENLATAIEPISQEYKGTVDRDWDALATVEGGLRHMYEASENVLESLRNATDADPSAYGTRQPVDEEYLDQHSESVHQVSEALMGHRVGQNEFDAAMQALDADRV